jgi:AraC family transcriptional regulator
VDVGPGGSVQEILRSGVETNLNETADLVAEGTKAPRRAVTGIGRVLLWSGGSVWVGRDAGRVAPHAHHAIQVSLAMDSRFLLGTGDGGWHEHRGAIVMPHRPHRFDGCGERIAMVFVEPETAQGRALLERYGGGDVFDLDADTAEALVAPLRGAYLAAAADESLIALGRDAATALAGHAPAAAGVDPRIARTIAWVRERLDAPLSLKDAADIAHLSPSRFRHLFVAQTGVSFRAYVLWARVESAVGAAMKGRSWTAAAQDAGFADSAHLSRTCRRMFGIAPATLVRE